VRPSDDARKQRSRHDVLFRYSPRDVDPAVVAAALRARTSGGDDESVPFAERAIAQLRKRLARLIRTKEQVEAMIASMERGLLLAAPRQ
jgi:hypothetical protein